MKFTTFVSVSLACLLQASVAQRGSSSTSSSSACDLYCDVSREYCDSSVGECRAASNGTECYNATAALFQDGCEEGHICIDDLCRTASDAIDNRTCSLICSAGKFCENGTTKCRAPDYDGECFNLETGLFQDGCDEGYYCSFNKCICVDSTQCSFMKKLVGIPLLKATVMESFSYLERTRSLLETNGHRLLVHIFMPFWSFLHLLSRSHPTMKIFALVFVVLANMVAASNSTSCYEACEGEDEYCEVSTGLCRGPSYDGECFNPAIGEYQDGCDQGFACIYNKCDYAVAHEEDGEYEDDSDSEADSESGCPTECEESREYCDSSIGECRAASNETECYNATAAVFQDGCDAGYDCIDDLCRVDSDPIDNRSCSLMCSAGKFCENETTKCRGPADGECFNLETGFFQDGCDEGYFCSFNKCVDVSLDD